MTHLDTAGALSARPATTAGAGARPDAPPPGVAEVLDTCRCVDVLHRRALPGHRGPIDWLVVSRSAVYVVDEYATGASRPSVHARRGGARAVDGTWVVLLDGLEQPGAVAGVRTRAQAVRDVLAEAGWSQGGLVVPVLCVPGGHLPPLRRQLRLGSCLVVATSGLGRLVRSGGELGADTRARITTALLEAFPPVAAAAA